MQTVTVTIPLEVFDRIFDILGSKHVIDPDTQHILSALQLAYEKRKNPSDEPINPITGKAYTHEEKVNSLAATILKVQELTQMNV